MIDKEPRRSTKFHGTSLSYSILSLSCFGNFLVGCRSKQDLISPSTLDRVSPEPLGIFHTVGSSTSKVRYNLAAGNERAERMPIESTEQTSKIGHLHGDGNTECPTDTVSTLNQTPTTFVIPQESFRILLIRVEGV